MNAKIAQGKDLPNWEAFHDEIRALNQRYGSRTEPLLYRGVPGSDLPLTTTLERAGCIDMSFSEFYRLISTRIQLAVETFTGLRWAVPPYCQGMEMKFLNVDYFFEFPSNELYEFLVYLRHHGFPSPLLDWSRSPYVAAFFAFRDMAVSLQVTQPEKRSIYVYRERTGVGGNGGVAGEPSMRALGPYVRSHPRHFRQQSNYTICAAFDAENGGWRFHPHGPVFRRRPGAEQGVLWKFNLPSSEGSKILDSLNQYNLNAFSLFDSAETMLETMWFREQVLRSMP